MSKTMMWAETDAQGFESECMFNEDQRSYEVMVCAKGRGFCLHESFPVQAEPMPDMHAEDRRRSIEIAERLTREVAHKLGDH
ncbi:hypothetical protein [Azospirillum thermophilum]|uniref:Uncharacterized protein n=1 Tax=Azospirillum thermophilum TaxID=2202148 RepID=A0A2S2CUP3_9PROT|nr:hypothetical protein [Azospirillum thermophilum]AWK88189.1 hypothetical protein DEW08_18920 [Azospirillum thermophilum]